MRVFVPSTLRAFWRDRAPTTIADNDTGAVPTGGSRTGANYQLPANRRAILEWVFVEFELPITMLNGQSITARLRFRNAADALIITSDSILATSEGPGTYRMWVNVGPIQMIDEQDLTIFGTSIGVANVIIRSSIWGVEYDV